MLTFYQNGIERIVAPNTQDAIVQQINSISSRLNTLESNLDSAISAATTTINTLLNTINTTQSMKCTESSSISISYSSGSGTGSKSFTASNGGELYLHTSGNQSISSLNIDGVSVGSPSCFMLFKQYESSTGYNTYIIPFKTSLSITIGYHYSSSSGSGTVTCPYVLYKR